MTQKDWKNTLRERFAAEGLTPSAHREAIDEIAEHLNDLHRAAERSGKSDEEAAAIVDAELAKMGPLAVTVADRARARSRSTSSDSDWKGGIASDCRQAMRSLKRERAFAATVIATLAIGIGACTTVFSFINGLLLGSLPYQDPARLVLFWECDANNRNNLNIVAKPVFDDWVRETRSFSSLGIWEYRSYNIASDREPEQVRGIRATAGLFTALGVPPALGRVFTQEEDDRDARVVVIGDPVWRTQFGADPSVIGKTLRLNGQPFEVIGVMPPGFQFPQESYRIWIPFDEQPQDKQRGSHSFFVAGRIAPGVTFEQARADVEQVGRSLNQRYEDNRREGSTITEMSKQGLGQLRRMLTALMGAVVLILVIGCVNVANLQLGRAITRQREFALRLSLGASMRRLARQLFTESLLLALVSGVCALALTWIALRAADMIVTPLFRTLPYRGEVQLSIDGAVIAFAALAAFASAVLFGFAPLVGLNGRRPNMMLREGERGSTAIGNFARRALVGIEVALAIVVLCGAGLLIKSLQGLMQVSPGLDPRDVMTMVVSLPQVDLYGPPQRQAFCSDLSRETQGLPGIRSVGAISHLPLSGANAGRSLTVEGYTPAEGETASASYRLTCPGYFATLSIPIIEGRDFNDGDVTKGERVAIINRALAQAYWKDGRSPIGRRLHIGGPRSDNPWLTVVGVVENVRHFGLDSDVAREFFLPYSQSAWPVMTIVAKTIGDPIAWQTPMKEAIRRIEPDLPVGRVMSMEQIIEGSIDWRETPMKLLTGFALIGLLLASIGVYGVLAYYVSQRTREIGVRAALGANRTQITAMVIRQSMLPIAIGVMLGIAGSFASGRLLTDFLYHVRPGDAQVTATIVVLLIVVGLFSSWLPARRAASIDPLVALRDE